MTVSCFQLPCTVSKRFRSESLCARPLSYPKACTFNPVWEPHVPQPRPVDQLPALLNQR